MKKLLILMLVLGLASAANATVMLSIDSDTGVEEITIDVGEIVTIDIYDDQVGGYVDMLYYLDIGMIAEGGYSLSDPRLGPAAGDFASFIQYTYLGYDEFEVSQTDTAPPDPPPGVFFLVDLTCELDGVDVLVYLADGYGTPLDAMTIHQIPEPATMALLGLGSLFLLRRRR